MASPFVSVPAENPNPTPSPPLPKPRRLPSPNPRRPLPTDAQPRIAGDACSAPRRTVYSDRFIPSRSASNFNLFDLSPSSVIAGGKENGSGAYNAMLRATIFGSDLGVAPALDTPEWSPGVRCVESPLSSSDLSPASNFSTPTKNIFRFKDEFRRYSLTAQFDYEADVVNRFVPSPGKAPRRVPRSPYKVLDAPALQDDFYLNLVDWSCENLLAVGLGNCVYLWNACSSKVTKLCDLGANDSVCSVGWAQRGSQLAIGTEQGKVQIWDVSRCRKIRTMALHSSRVGALAWSSSLLSSGSKDKTIILRDIRAQEDYISMLTGHKSEVCGLRWSCDNRQLASGGNDNKLFVWNQHSTKPILRYCQHTAAVKAIAWSPHIHGLLASGGGTADRCIRFWNTTTNSHQSSVDTGSQVCNLAWSKNVNELVSTHGYSQNQIIVWRYPTMSKLATLTGHTYRVLYLATSPDGQTIVTGAGDETLRFWNVFPSPKFQNTDNDIGARSLGRSHIR